MIQSFYKEDITKRLAAIITYGLNGKYSYGTIEERIVASPFVNCLEKNFYNSEESIEKVVEDAFKVALEKEADISFRALFLAESYIRLFFSVDRSFEYLFLYWDLGNFVSKYGVYHEMDFSNLMDDFLSNVHKTPLLRKLSLRKGVNLRNVARLTGISENTINKYAKDDKYLYSCSHENGYRLSTLFNVKENLFIQNIGVYLDVAIYLSDDFYKDYRNYLGFYYACYFDKKLDENDFSYDENGGCFVSKEGKVLRVLTCDEEGLTLSFVENKTETGDYAVLFLSGVFSEHAERYFALKNEAIHELLLIGPENVYLVNKGRKIRIGYTVMNFLIIKAKRRVSSCLDKAL